MNPCTPGTDRAPVSLTRRGFLQLVGTLVGVGGVALASPPDAADARIPRWLRELLADPGAMAGFGRSYLAQHPQEKDPTRLAESVRRALPETRPGEPDDWLARANAAVEADYARGDTVMLTGWIISRTEARIYALAALATR